jgi:hypothetical protein
MIHHSSSSSMNPSEFMSLAERGVGIGLPDSEVYWNVRLGRSSCLQRHIGPLEGQY